jgi:anaerobic sulfite reductase subunit C
MESELDRARERHAEESVVTVEKSEERRTPLAAAEDLKAGGFIPQRQAGKITIRCKAPGGRVTAERLARIAEVARKYGSGFVHLSVRMSPEIIGVDLADLDAVAAELAEVGQEIASCGKRFRVTTGCGGCEYNPNGLVDSQRLAREATELFFGIDTPHKFKTTFAGCPIDCVRSRQTDLGGHGMVEPALAAANCTKCGLCRRACKHGALAADEEGRPVRDPDRCVCCGRCISVCAFDAMGAGRTGLALYVGGKHGMHPHVAYPVAALVPERQVAGAVRVTLDWYREQGERGERIGDTLDRVGLESYRRALKCVVGSGLLIEDEVRKPKWSVFFYPGVVEAFPPYGEV